MLYTHQINININPNSAVVDTQTVNIVQGDVNTNKFIISIKDDTKDYFIPDIAIARFMARKTDGTQVLADCDIIDNNIEILMPQQVFTSIGTVICSIGLYNNLDNELLVSLPFCINVIENSFKPSSVYSSDEYGSLTNALFSVDAAIDATSKAVSEAIDATNNANQAADNANNAANPYNIEEKANAAQEAANAATQATAAADIATTNATNAATYAVTSATNCDIAIKQIPEAIEITLEENDITKDGYHRYEDNSTFITDTKSVNGNIQFKSILGNTTQYVTDPSQEISPQNIATLFSVGKDSKIDVFSSSTNLFTTSSWHTCSTNVGHPANIDTASGITINTYDTNNVAFETSSTYRGVLSDCFFVPKGTFTASFNSNNSNRFFICKYNNRTNSVVSTLNSPGIINGFNSQTVYIDEPCYIIVSFANTFATNDISVTNIQFQYGSDYTGFEPFVALNDYSLALLDKAGNNLSSLFSLPNGICDRLIKKDGVWGIERNCSCISLSGNETWSTDTSKNTENTFYAMSTVLDDLIADNNSDSGNNIYSSHFENRDICNSDLEGIINLNNVTENKIAIRINSSRLTSTTIDGFMDYLANQASVSTPVKIVYPLSTSTWTALSDDSQILLENIMAYEDTTYVCTGELAPINLMIPKGYYPSSNLLNEVYPIGSVYISIDNTSPQAVFGGTWESLTLGITGIYGFKRTA